MKYSCAHAETAVSRRVGEEKRNYGACTRVPPWRPRALIICQSDRCFSNAHCLRCRTCTKTPQRESGGARGRARRGPADPADVPQPAAPTGACRAALLVAAVNNIYSSRINIKQAGEKSAQRKITARFVRRAHFWIMHVGNSIQLRLLLCVGSIGSVCLHQLDLFQHNGGSFLK